MKKITILCTAIIFLSVFNGCQKEEFDNGELPNNISLQQQGQFTFHEGQMILGKKLENPYSVKNMKAAYETLQANNTLKSKLKIEPTHYYVRFRPKNGKKYT